MAAGRIAGEILMTHEDVNHIVDGYLEYARGVVSGNRDASQWAMEAIDKFVRDDPEIAWSIIVKLIAGAENDRVLAFVAAGPLEELLVAHGLHVMSHVENLAKSDDKFRR